MTSDERLARMEALIDNLQNIIADFEIRMAELEILNDDLSDRIDDLEENEIANE